MALTRRFGTTQTALGGVVLLAALWVAFTMGLLAGPLAALTANATLLVGVGALALLGWWVWDEVEEDDDLSSVVSKTGDRAERASRGFLDGMAAVILAVAAVAFTIGDVLLGGLAGFADQLVQAPLVAANLAGIGLGLAGIMGFLGANVYTIAALALLLTAMVIRRR
ncbi:hypothetical protein ACFQH6_19385 [Halobacteriaceae archaeon GCM10025711]